MKKNFSDFNIQEEILNALDKLGYESPMDVQEKVIPLVLEGRDLLVKSQTGSGKTASFAIPLCHMVEIEEREPQALVLAPTRELALQIKEDVKNIGRFKKIRATALYGRHPIDLQKNELRQRVHIVVGTPGRVMDHIRRGNLDVSRIKYLVIDEADEMLNMGFIDQVEEIIHVLPKKRVTLLFSATLPERIEEIGHEYLSDPIRIDVQKELTSYEKIDQVIYDVSEADKVDAVKRVLEHEVPGSCILFCNTRDKVEELYSSLRQKRFSCAPLHGGMSQRDRIRTITGFKKGQIHYLVATDVAARGIDVEDITHVINYDVPFERESYVHRIGRTGRQGQTGKAITLVTDKETRRIEEIEDYVGYAIPRGDLDDLTINVKKNPRAQVKPKANRDDEINKAICRIRINAGKKKKIRPVDVVGAISNIEGVGGDDIGIIDIQDTCTYVEIFNGQGKKVLKGLRAGTIKGKKITVKEMA